MYGIGMVTGGGMFKSLVVGRCRFMRALIRAANCVELFVVEKFVGHVNRL